MIIGERHSIMVIEDAALFGDAIVESVRAVAEGLQVTRFVGVVSVDADKIVAIRPGPQATWDEDSFNGELDRDRLCYIQTTSVRIAFIDGGLVTGSLKGRDITLLLTQCGIVCIAITGSGAGNPPLLAAGASMGLPKELVVRATQAGVLVPADVLRDTVEVALRLKALVAELDQERRQAHEDGRRFDFGFDVTPIERGVA